jgi:hypothetical protein
VLRMDKWVSLSSEEVTVGDAGTPGDGSDPSTGTPLLFAPGTVGIAALIARTPSFE